MIDIVGIGALNVDFIATRERLLGLQADLIPEVSSRFEHGSEINVKEAEIDDTLRQMGMGAFEVFLGGSSFNTIHSIAHTNPGLRIGYVGIAGNADPAPQSFIQAMQSLRIDTSFVLSRDDVTAGRCVSYISEGERSLLTTPGVNLAFANFLSDNRKQILDYITSAKLVHVTSFLDPDSPRLVSELLKKAKKRNPWLKLSFDPGHVWIANQDESVLNLLKIADYVFLNNREFLTLGHHRPGTNDLNVARQIFRLCNDSSLLIVLKRYDSIALYYKIQGRILGRTFPNQFLTQDVIEDATGAGDIFAAGFLVAILVPGMEYGHGVELGLRLVRTKLLVPGYKCFSTYSSIFTGMVDEITSGASRKIGARNVSDKLESIFIGHGSSGLYAVLEKYLREACPVPCETWESESHTGQQVISVLERMLDTSTFAIIVATADDETKDGFGRARQNVVHEIGLFQGRLGFNRVVLMMQEGIEGFSNIAGLQVIRFSGNRIDSGFYELDRVLRREKVIA